MEQIYGPTKTTDRVPKFTEQYRIQMKKTISGLYQEVRVSRVRSRNGNGLTIRVTVGFALGFEVFLKVRLGFVDITIFEIALKIFTKSINEILMVWPQMGTNVNYSVKIKYDVFQRK